MKYCCEDMCNFVREDTDDNSEIYQNPDILIVYIPKFDEYGLIIHDGGESSVQINYCPWCGKRLPESKRDIWFEELEKKGIEDFSGESIPEKYKTDEWWRNSKK